MATRILCLGNELVRDDGVGIRIGRILGELPLPAEVCVELAPHLGFALLDVVAGADCVMLASSLLTNGPGHVGTLVRGLQAWMTEREYTSVAQMKGSLSQRSCPDPGAFERANYMKALKSYSSEFV